MPDQTVVVADDDPAILQLMQLVLQDEGFGVRTARDGREALDLVAEERPSAVVVDLRMPVVDGYGVVLSLRTGLQTRTIPIVAISAECAGSQLRLLKVDAFLHKPFEIDELVNTVKGLLA